MNDANPLEEVIFNAARQFDNPDKCRQYLDLACEGKPELRHRIERLLKTSDEADAFFGRTATFTESVGAPVKDLAGASARAPTLEQSGTRIGRYRLLEQIGEGGFGVVFMAEQEEPVRRKVALKLIKLGMDTKQVLARFEAERQALALMDHPNIARVLDGGATDTGRPYFVMELVQGVPITEFCDKNQLSVEQRLKLFIPICQAIQSAHQKGIIHRDLKPTNILVTLNPDGSGFPKVIDFGVAKATDQKLTEKTLFTAHGMMVGTPAYMSPEQAEMSHLDVDTRADIYSLGALLYELLTGTPPFPEQRLRSAGYNEMQRIILEEQPERPSMRLSTLRGEQRSVVARNRGATELTLGRAFPGDLDWIVMKCLEKERARRYETANGLARDLERHLKNEPVVARPPSRLYEFQKTLRRHWVGFSAVAGIVLALTVAVVVSSLQTARARRAEALAKERLAESLDVSRFLTQVFASPDPARDGRTITVVESLAAAAKKLETDLSTQPERVARLQATLGLTYCALGLDREAIPLQEKSRDYFLRAFGPEHPATLSVMADLAGSYDAAGRFGEALKLRQQVLDLRRKLLGPKDPETLIAMHNLTSSYIRNEREEEALKLAEELLTLRRQVSGPRDPQTLLAMRTLFSAYISVERMDHGLDRWDKGANLGEEVVKTLSTVKGPRHPDTLTAMYNLAIAYQKLERWDDALKLLQEQLPMTQAVMGAEHRDTLWTKYALSASYVQAGRLDEAIKLREELVAFWPKVIGPKHPAILWAKANLADSYGYAGRTREAINLWEQVRDVNPEDPDPQLAVATWQAWCGLGTDYQSTCRGLVELAQGTNPPGLAESVAKACCLQLSTNTALMANALELARRAVSLEKDGPRAHLALGMAQYRNRQYAEAEKTLAAQPEEDANVHDLDETARLFQAMTVFQQGRTNEARALLRHAEGQMPPFPRDENKPFAGVKHRGAPVNNLQSIDLLIYWMAFKEARGALGDAGDTTPGPPLR